MPSTNNIRFFHAQNNVLAPFTPDPDASQYISVLEGFGAVLSDTDEFVIHRFFKRLKRYGIYSKVVLMYPLIGNNDDSQSVQAKSASSVSANNLVYTGNPSHSENGMVTNGFTNWADTGFVIPASMLNSAAMTVAVGSLGGRGIACGNHQSGVGSFFIGPTSKISVSNEISRISSLTGGYNTQFTQSYVNGFIQTISRINSTQISGYRRQYYDSAYTVNMNSTANATNTVTIGKVNYTGNTSFLTDWGFYEYRFFAITEGLTQTEAERFNIEIDNLNKGLGRAIMGSDNIDMSLATADGLFLEMDASNYSDLNPGYIKDSIQDINWNIVAATPFSENSFPVPQTVMYTGINPEGVQTRKCLLLDTINPIESPNNGWTDIFIGKYQGGSTINSQMMVGHEPVNIWGYERSLILRANSFIWGSVTGLAIPATGPLIPSPPQYRFIAMRCDGINVVTNLETTTQTAVTTGYTNTLNTPCVGGRISEQNQWQGWIALYRCYNKFLSDAEINAIYNQLKPIYNLP